MSNISVRNNNIPSRIADVSSNSRLSSKQIRGLRVAAAHGPRRSRAGEMVGLEFAGGARQQRRRAAGRWVSVFGFCRAAAAAPLGGSGRGPEAGGPRPECQWPARHRQVTLVRVSLSS
jgi:hypothetical protein